MIHAKFPLVIGPIQLRQVEMSVICNLYRLCGFLVVKNPKSIEAVTFPTARVAYLAAWVVEHSVALEFALRVKLSLVSGSILKIEVSVSSVAYFGGLSHAFLVLLEEGSPVLYFSDCSELLMLGYSFNWCLKLSSVHFLKALKGMSFRSSRRSVNF